MLNKVVEIQIFSLDEINIVLNKEFNLFSHI